MSWYPNTVISPREERYLRTIQKIFRVQDSTRKWVDFDLTPHQIEWHRDDVAIQGHNAKTRIVYKSRNTSFTTDSFISLLMGVGHYPEQVEPFVRLNQQRANDLINECKKLVKHIKTVIKMKDGRLYPFDPDMVNTKSKGALYFTDRDVEFRAFPATASSSEIIRGLRIAGPAGMIDEGNFMRDYENIYIALRDAAAGFDKHGHKHYQINIGTTLKGNATPFKLWLDNQIESKITSNKIYHWPVFDPDKFNPDIPITDQGLDPIVHWHNVVDLESKRRENLMRFLEEYMGVAVDSSDVLYAQDLILRSIDTAMENMKFPTVQEIFYMGVDVGYTNDFFAISIWGKSEIFRQRFLFYKQGCDPQEMEELSRNLIRIWNPAKARIDANGVGFQIGQTLKKEFGNTVEAIRTNTIKGLSKKDNIPFSEFIHTNQLWLMRQNKFKMLNDEMQIIHYGVWDNKYNAPRTQNYGHGDITIANGMALLPLNWRTFKGFTDIKTNLHSDKMDKETKEILEDFSKTSMKDKMDFYRRGRR